ncbi:MAG: DEAD/DEAH box helicase [Candidatus Micrarchaeota archaeon]|nr:DEAD/DEAH box helicase [Candidatus Micrarchaeota archaeon]
MDINDLVGKLPNEAIESMTNRGIITLTPPQENSVKEGLLTNKSFVIAAPTASGKTLIAEMAMVKSVIWDRKKAVYVAPMRALVREKYTEFKAAYPFLKIAMSVGDLDSLDRWLEEYDIILVSTEKFDSLIRHGLHWLGSIGCVVIDEVHMIGEPGRGPTLEILISKLKRMSSDAQIICLSATIGNTKELAGWLRSELIESDYRPVPLEKGIELNGAAQYDSGKEEKLDSHSKIPEIRIIEDTIRKGKQAIIFYSTKRNAEAGAERLSKDIGRHLSKEEKEDLSKISAEVLDALSKPTAQCEKEAKAILGGAAFHHSGLVNEQRSLIEDAFRAGKLKVVCSTTTLGLGVNLPAHTVVVRDTFRYGESGSEYIGINEITQLFGRAGRPKYDKTGRALLIAQSKPEAVDLYNRYILSDLDPITSNLGILPILRTHILAFVATKFLTSEESMQDFLNTTFYGYQYANSSELKMIIASILKELYEWGFVEKRGSIYKATAIGERVSELYIDPLSARWILDALPKIKDDKSILFMISNTLEMRPYVKATEDANEEFLNYHYMLEGTVSSYEADEFAIYDPVKPFSTALMLNDWIEEKTEKDIIKAYRTTPGALFTKVSNADWLLYASTELAKLVRINTLRLLEARIRVKYGVKKELLDLIRLEQVGRVRARLMHEKGIRSVADLRKKESESLVIEMFGNEIAGKILSQVSTDK